MDVLEAIKTRRSIRKYLDSPVPWDLIGQLLEAGKSAPSAGNLQNWKFVVVLDEGKRAQVAEACLQQHWMAQAPVHIIVVGQPTKAIRFYGIRGDRLYTIQNCAAAIQNMLIMANSLGLGTCWIGAFDENMLKRELGITEEVRPQAVITVGYPAESVPEPMQFTLENVTFLEKYGSRIKNLDAVLGNFGQRLQQHVGASIDILSKEVNKGIHKIKKKLSRKKPHSAEEDQQSPKV
jgi:nitroreductase